MHAQFRRIRYPKSSNDYLYGDRDWPQRYPLHTPYCQGRTPIPMSHNKAAIVCSLPGRVEHIGVH